jgi:ppGpp synthetase/RelA/SpoT-type nucleotidyltranferase
MAPLRLITTHEVAAFLNDNEWRYLDVLRVLKDLLDGYALTEEGRVVVYSVYSRGVKQRGGSEFKDVWQIKWKVNDKRTHGRPTFAIQDVGDVIGLTVVCNYPSQVALAEAYLDARREAGILDIRDPETKREQGYRARHLTVGLCDRQYRGVRCEVQLKTVLHDAWTRWNHDLTYKPQGALPRDIDDQMHTISGALTLAESHTELLKEGIEKNWQLEQKAKDAARLAIVAVASAQVGTAAPTTERSRKYIEVVVKLRDNPTPYRSGGLDEEPVATMLARIDALADGGYDVPSCWAMIVLAALRDADDLDYVALDYIERWVNSASDQADRLKALRSKAFALFVFNHLPAAADAAELELEETERTGDEEAIALSQANVAAHLAEVGHDRMAERARELAEAVIDYRGRDDLPADELDTIGLVKIVFGETKEEIREGMELCKEAVEEAGDEPGKLAAKAFYELRMNLAKERLERLEETA